MCPNFVLFQIEKKKLLMHYIIVIMYIICHNWVHNCSALVFVKGGYSLSHQIINVIDSIVTYYYIGIYIAPESN